MRDEGAAVVAYRHQAQIVVDQRLHLPGQPPAVPGQDGAQGAGFLAELCAAWEQATAPAAASGIRVVLMRIGVVLSPQGGALAKIFSPSTVNAT